MNIHTYSDNVKVVNSVCLAPTSGTQHGSTVDSLEFRRAAVVVTIDTGSATTINFQLADSPDGTTFTNVANATLASPVAASTAEASYIINVDLAKRQRYLRVDLIGTGTAGFMVANVHLFEGELLAPAQEQTVISV